MVDSRSISLFKALGDGTRLRIINCLVKESKNVNKISEETQISQSAISHQLKILREVDIVRFIQNGKERLYYISDDHVKMIIEQVYQHVSDCGEELWKKSI